MLRDLKKKEAKKTSRKTAKRFCPLLAVTFLCNFLDLLFYSIVQTFAKKAELFSKVFSVPLNARVCFAIYRKRNREIVNPVRQRGAARSLCNENDCKFRISLSN